MSLPNTLCTAPRVGPSPSESGEGRGSAWTGPCRVWVSRGRSGGGRGGESGGKRTRGRSGTEDTQWSKGLRCPVFPFWFIGLEAVLAARGPSTVPKSAGPCAYLFRKLVSLA